MIKRNFNKNQMVLHKIFFLLLLLFNCFSIMFALLGSSETNCTAQPAVDENIFQQTRGHSDQAIQYISFIFGPLWCVLTSPVKQLRTQTGDIWCCVIHQHATVSNMDTGNCPTLSYTLSCTFCTLPWRLCSAFCCFVSYMRQFLDKHRFILLFFLNVQTSFSFPDDVICKTASTQLTTADTIL